MGKFTKGLNGPFTGRVGVIIGSTWMGIPVLRSQPNKRSTPFKEDELKQQARFRIITAFLKPLSYLLRQSFTGVAGRMTGFNRAFSYNVKNALTGTAPDLQINFAMVKIGRGDLPNVDSVSFAVKEKVLALSWNDNSGLGRAQGTDQVYVASYDEASGSWNYVLQLARRSEGGCLYSLASKSGSHQLYLGFISADGQEKTDSLYVGRIDLSLENAPEKSLAPGA
ncbi:MAG TPA: DUF6266 family protein [Puia sp.]|nr:DUF6266 family protein [Puia sp.]